MLHKQFYTMTCPRNSLVQLWLIELTYSNGLVRSSKQGMAASSCLNTIVCNGVASQPTCCTKHSFLDSLSYPRLISYLLTVLQLSLGTSGSLTYVDKDRRIRWRTDRIAWTRDRRRVVVTVRAALRVRSPQGLRVWRRTMASWLRLSIEHRY